MAANSRSHYTQEDKAKVLAVLAGNGGNIKRTARETGVPVNTVRRWKTQNAQGQGPPSAVVVAAVTEFVDEAEGVRNLALASLKAKIAAGDMTGSALVAAIGMLDDKIRVAKGMPNRTVEHTHTLPPPDQVRELLQGYGQALIQGAERRTAEIVDAEVVAEIPAAT